MSYLNQNKMSNLPTCKESKKFIKKLKKELNDRGILEDIDDQMMDQVEMNHHKWYVSSEFLLKNGFTYSCSTREGDKITKEYPQVKMQLDADIQLQKILSQYGGTANSRNKIKDITVTKDDDSPLAEFLHIEKR